MHNLWCRYRSWATGARVLTLWAAGFVAAVSQAAEPPAVVVVRVPMRDGILLATDVYRAGDSGPGPVVLMRTPYNKDRAQPVATRYARAGYTAVVQDCRGKFQSEGAFVPYNNEGQDGFDAIEWIRRQPWCNGRIGMWGGSYVGATQWQAAVERPPGLVTITPTATWTSFYRNLYLGGAVRLSLITTWAAGNSPRPADVAPPADWNATLLHLPLSDFDRAIGWPIPWLTGMLTHPSPDGYWTRLDLTDQVTQLDLPVQHVVGYYDFFARESVGNFVRLQQQARNPVVRRQQQLILGPWDHGTIGQSQVGEIDFGPQAVWDAAGENLAWFDRFLKQDPDAAAKPFSPVRYFSMGENQWREAATWPPPGFDSVSFYLHSGGRANSRRGDGTLNRDPPAADEPNDSFRADPSHPVPACPVTDKRPLSAATWAPVDQTAIEDRADVLVYTSAPFTEPLTFAGDVAAELFVSADTPDADWVVKLVDVAPSGTAHQLAVGIVRGRFRVSESKPMRLNPGEVYPVTVDLGPVAAQIGRGHSLRVDVCGAYFPLFDRNPNTGEGPTGRRTLVSTESVMHRPTMASRIILPCARNASHAP